MAKQMGKKHKYTKQEFINICCNQCGLCDEGTTPSLCYSKFYVKHPKKFIKGIFKDLLKRKSLIDKNVCLQLQDVGLGRVFRKVFCTSNLCNKYSTYKQCNDFHDCLDIFRHQINRYSTITSCIGKKSDRKQRYVVQAYPTFFTNDNSVFHEEIEKILKKSHNSPS